MSDAIDGVAFCELSKAKARYCRALDTREWAILADLLTEDVEFGMSDGDSEPQMTHGRDATITLLRGLVAGARTAHHVHNPEISVTGSEADVIWAVQDRAVFDSGLSVTGFGYYYERWVRQGHSWRVSSLLLTHMIIDVRHADSDRNTTS